MRVIRQFMSDQRGDGVKSLTVAAAVIAFASLAMTQLLEKASKEGVLPQIAIVATPGDARLAALPRPTGTSVPGSANVDSTPVASIGGRPVPRVVLDPCTGQSR